MTVNLAAIGTRAPLTEISWDPRDCALFALACGAGFESSSLLFPGPDGTQQVLPALPLALVSADAGRRADPLLGAGNFTGKVQVLAKQSLRLHRPLPAQGQASMQTWLSAIHDIGSAAIVILETIARDSGGVPLFTAETVMHIAGEGGFGGSPLPRPLKLPMPAGSPFATFEMETLPVQSLLYGLVARDANGIHVDPAVAASAGLSGPILAGHNVLGMVSNVLARGVAEGDASRVLAMTGRFTRPSYNGDKLAVRVWTAEHTDCEALEEYRFDVVNQNGETVLDSGECLIARSAAAAHQFYEDAGWHAVISP